MQRKLNKTPMVASPPTSLSRTARQVIILLRKHGQLSRSQLAKAVGVTRAAMAQTINMLLDQNIVQIYAVNKHAQGGRPAESFELTGNGFVTVGIYINTRIQLVITNSIHNVLSERQIANSFSDVEENDSRPIEELIEQIDALHKTKQINTDIQGIGICVVGCVSSDGRTSNPNMMASEQQASTLRDRLTRAFGCPVRFVNNVQAPLLTERWGAQDIPNDPSLLYVDEHLGFALYVCGQLVRGPVNANLWLGRFQIDQHGAIWKGHTPGQLAASASLASITDQMAGFVFGTRPHITPSQMDQKIQHAFMQYEQNNIQVVHLFHRAFDHLGIALRNLTILFSPQLIILDGWTPAILKQGVIRIQEILDQTEFDAASEVLAPRVRAASLGQFQHAIGASIDITDKVLVTTKEIEIPHTQAQSPV